MSQESEIQKRVVKMVMKRSLSAVPESVQDLFLPSKCLIEVSVTQKSE